MSKLHGIRVLPLLKTLQIRARVALAAAKQPTEQQIQNKIMLKLQEEQLLYVWEKM